jgi:single-stranded-DNA-specific exonuclease
LAFHFENGVATGSGRSAADFDLHELVEGLQPLLLRGGGHRAACGMSLQTANWEALRTAVREHAGSKLSLGDLVRRVEADCEVGGRDLTPQLVADLARLEPCGQGNPEPRLMLRGATLVDGRGMGAASEHLKWNIEHEGRSCEAVWWRPGERGEGFAVGSRIDLCFAPELNNWNGNTRLQLVIKDARPAA